MKNYKERFKKLLDYYKEELSNLKKEEVEIVAKLEVFLYLLEEELSIEFEESKKGYSKDYKEIDFVIKGYEGKVTINNKEYIVSKEGNIIKIEK